MDLEFTINEQICRIKDKRQQVVDLSENYLVLSFTFSDDWTGASKFILYHLNDGEVWRQAVTNDKTIVPADVLTGDYFHFTVYGIQAVEEKRITTNLVKVNLLKSGFTSDTVTPGEDHLYPDVVEQIYIAIDAKVNISDYEREITSIQEDLNEIHTELDTKSNLGHTHVTTDITDFPEVYTKTEIDNIINTIQNNIKLELEPIIINGETTPITVYVKKDGFPLPNETIYIYQEE